MKRWIIAAAAALLLAVPAVAQSTRVRPAIDTDEGGLWGLSDRIESEAAEAANRNHDDALNSYVRGVLCRVAAHHCADLRLYIFDIPLSNASMFANGMSHVWSGLLLRAENEAQLAFILGHETAHYSERHTLRNLRVVRARTTFATVVTMGVAAGSIYAAYENPELARNIADLAGNLIDATYLAAMASIFAHERASEEEADRLGFDYFVQAGYEPREAARFWRWQIEEAQRSDFQRVRRRQAHAGLFDTHPLDGARAETLERRALLLPEGEIGRARYRAAIRPFLDPWLRDELRRRDYGQTLFLIDRLAADGEDLGVLNYYRGESFRLRRRDGDLARARDAYEEAIRHADAPALAWRQLGDIYERERRPLEAAAHLRVYLEKAPAASDRLLIERRIATLAPAGVAP